MRDLRTVQIMRGLLLGLVFAVLVLVALWGLDVPLSKMVQLSVLSAAVLVTVTWLVRSERRLRAGRASKGRDSGDRRMRRLLRE